MALLPIIASWFDPIFLQRSLSSARAALLCLCRSLQPQPRSLPKATTLPGYETIGVLLFAEISCEARDERAIRQQLDESAQHRDLIRRTGLGDVFTSFVNDLHCLLKGFNSWL